jgi:hypothetical protein
MKIEIRIKIIEGCCNGLAIARQWAALGPKIKKMGFRCSAGPKNGQKARSKIFILSKMTGYGMAPKIGNSTEVKFEFGAPELSPSQNSKPKSVKAPE